MQNSSAPRSSIDVGSVINGTYIIEALIGRGGMGAVFLAGHNRLPGKKVAIKVLHAEMSGDEIMARFKREAQIASMLSHPNIVHIEDYNVTSDGMPFLVLEYLKGESLAQRLHRGPIPLEQVTTILRQVGSALAAAHAKGIVHRDLKPQNIFLVPDEIDETRTIAKILDFGISKMRDSQTVKTQDSALLGTPQYMAPEQATGQHDKVDERTDIFALGAIVYEMLCGQPAFSGLNIPEVVFKVVYEQPIALDTRIPGLPDHVKAAVDRALSKSADARFPSVSSFLEALTGAPVSLIRKPVAPVTAPPAPVAFAQGSQGPDAFANTMGSGDHAGALAATSAPGAQVTPVVSQVKPASQASVAAAPFDANAATIASQSGSPVATIREPEKPRSKAPLAIGLVVAIGVIATVGYLATRKSDAPKQVAQVAAPDVKQDPPPQPDNPSPTVPPVVAAVIDAGVAEPTVPADAAAPADAPAKQTPSNNKNKVGNTTAKQVPDADAEEPEADDDSRASKKLRAAQEALARGDLKEAEQNANLVQGAEDAKPKQKLVAKMIHGIVACKLRNDEEAALSDVKQLRIAPKLRKRVIDACQSVGYLQGQR